MSQITVGISDLNICRAPDTLVTYALGSCVGICLFDPMKKMAGLSHIMLPASQGFSATGGKEVMKFADTAIPLLVKKLEAAGCMRGRFQCKIAGGAQMFAGVNNSSLANIGARNVQAVKQALGALRIPIMAEDTGKNYGRTLYLTAEDGVMRIKSVSKGEWVF